MCKKCGCNTCETITGPLLTESKVKSLLSEGLQYHIDKQIPLFETIYRIGSDSHLSLIKEARKMYSRNVIDLCEEDVKLIKTHLGEFGLYEGVKVPLDLPMINEEKEYSLMDILKIKDKIKEKGFDVKVGRPDKNDPRIPIQYDEEKEKNIDGLILVLDKMFKDNYVLVSDTNQKMLEAEYQGRDVELNKPKRGGSKKFYVYVRDPKTKKVKKVQFGAKGGGQNLKVKFKDPKIRKAFADRHNCDQKKDRTKPGYWSCNLPRYAQALGLGGNMNTFW